MKIKRKKRVMSYARTLIRTTLMRKQYRLKSLQTWLQTCMLKSVSISSCTAYTVCYYQTYIVKCTFLYLIPPTAVVISDWLTTNVGIYTRLPVTTLYRPANQCGALAFLHLWTDIMCTNIYLKTCSTLGIQYHVSCLRFSIVPL